MDYNIYIHSIQDGGSPSPTTPWKPENKEGEGTMPWKKAAETVSNPSSLVSGPMGALSKAIPAVAAAYVAVKIGQKAYALGVELSTIQTGNYTAKVEMDNIRNVFSWIVSPYSHALSYYKAQQQFAIEDAKRAQDRALFGDATLNRYTRRGV